MKTADVAEDRIQTGLQLWDRWTAMWNGDLAEAQAIIAEGFYVHLTSKQVEDPALLRNADAVAAWVVRVRGKYDQLRYATDAGPFVDTRQLAVTCYWKAQAVPAGSANEPAGKEMTIVGTDILKFRDGKIVECWTMSKPLE